MNLWCIFQKKYFPTLSPKAGKPITNLSNSISSAQIMVSKCPFSLKGIKTLWTNRCFRVLGREFIRWLWNILLLQKTELLSKTGRFMSKRLGAKVKSSHATKMEKMCGRNMNKTAVGWTTTQRKNNQVSYRTLLLERKMYIAQIRSLER